VPTFSHTIAIVNSQAGGGSMRRIWPQLLREMVRATRGRLSVRWTPSPQAATRLTRQALQDGADRVVAVGGDGTLHEVVNGFFENGQPIAPRAVLVHLPCGTGGDFRRALQVGNGLASTRQLWSPQIRAVDLLRVRYTTGGDTASRYVVNVASCGLGGLVVQSVEHAPARLGAHVGPLGGTLVYLGAILYRLTTAPASHLHMEIDGRDLGVWSTHTVAVANGPSFGGGLQIAPGANIDDGRFDLVLLEDVSLSFLLRHAHRFYRGSHGSLAGVHRFCGTRLHLRPARPEPIWLEGDGEPLGRLPATVDLLPGALRVQSSPDG
jgi:YegS/Rv2252/BmrU family lipid kinase